MAVATHVRRLGTELGRWLRLRWPWLRWLLLAFALVAVVVVTVLWPLPALLTRRPSHGLTAAERLKATNDVRGTLVQALAGLALLGGLFFTSRTFRLTREGQLTDRYTKAVEQLGNEKLDVCLGGIYALERIAIDSARDHPTVVEVPSAFVRDHSQLEPKADHSQLEPKADVQAAVTVLGRLPHREEVVRATLTKAKLAKVKLAHAKLHKAGLAETNLFEANLGGAELTGADLGRADLTRADLGGANLSGAWLAGANLSGAELGEVDLSGANLGEANLNSAHLRNAKNVRQDQLEPARGDALTELPEGLQRPSAWVVDSET